jgi:DNA-binding response OmpR family regulator
MPPTDWEEPLFSSTPALERDATPRRGGLWVLVADDEPVVRDLVQRFLTLEGYRVMCAGDGVEAVALFREHPGTFCAVILDILMPRMDGHDAFFALRQQDPLIPVLFMSAFTPGERAAGIMGQPNTNYISKPFVLGDVLFKLEALIREQNSTATLRASAPPSSIPRLEGLTD